jgi:hypothetical protein
MRDVLCLACGYRGAARKVGCVYVALACTLLLFGILPGIIYGLYLDAWSKRCPNCDQKQLIPADSPNAVGTGGR